MTKEQLAEEIKLGLQNTGCEEAGREKPELLFADWLADVPTLDNPRCFIYAGMWCTFSQLLVTNFLIKAQAHGKDLRSLREVYHLFRDDFASIILLDDRQEEFEKRARKFLDYVGDLDLSKYGVPEYDKASEWI